MKVVTKGEKLWLRVLAATFVGMALDSVIFILIAFAGQVSGKQLALMMVFQYIMKVAFEIILMPVTCRIIGVLKRREGIDTFDYDHKYRVF